MISYPLDIIASICLCAYTSYKLYYVLFPSNKGPTITEIEKVYLKHKNQSTSNLPLMHKKQIYIELYNKKMMEFYNEMMTLEYDGLNPLEDI